MAIQVALLAAAFSAAAPVPAGPAALNRAIIELVDIDSLGISPNGDTLLFRTSQADIATNRYRLDWYALDTRSGAARRIGSGGEAVFDDPGVLRAETPVWLDDGRQAIIRKRERGATGLWAFAPATALLSPVVVGDADIEAPRLAPDGRSILYDVGPGRAAIALAEEDERDRGIRISPRVDLAQNLYRGGMVEGRRASQRLTGYWYMRGGLLANSPRQTRRWSGSTGLDEAVGSPTVPAAFKPPAITSVASLDATDGARADAFWDGFAGRVDWRRRDGTSLSCRNPACGTMRVSSFAWRKEGGELLVTLADRHLRQSLALWDVENNAFRMIAGGDGLLNGGRRGSAPCAVGRAAAFCVKADVAGPPQLVRIDLPSGTARTLFDANSALRQSYRPRVEPILFKLADGTPVAGVLLGNPSLFPGRTPLFVNYNRCEGFLRGGEGDEWPIAALLDAGFRIACLNAAPFRGSQDAIRTYDDGLAAVRLLVDQLDTSGRIDRRRVAMGGFSFGSEVAMWTAMKSDLLAAVSVASAQPEASDYWFGAILGPSHDTVERKVWGLGRPDETPDRWHMVSPALNANAIRAPVLLQLDEQEARRIPELFVRLRAADTPVEFWAFPDEDHLKVEPRHRLSVFERNYDWFTYWLTGQRDPDPDKVEQYRRWDQMRARQSARAGMAPAH